MGNQRLGPGALVCVLAAAVLTACGGGGGEGVIAPPNLAGWWEVAGRPDGGTKPFEPFTIIQAAETGSSFWANGTEFTRTGNQLLATEPDATDPDREVISLTVLSANLLEGTVRRYERDLEVEATELSVQRTTAPMGAFTMTGSVAGTPANVSSTTAYGALHEGGSESEFGIYDVVPYERETLLEVRAQETPLQIRAYTVGVGPGTIEASVALGEDDEEATSGTVTLTSVGARLVGTYDLTLPGGAVTGTFDVEVLVPRLP